MYHKKLIVVIITTMDIANKDIWLEIVLYLDAVSAIHLRKTSTFFAFIDTLYLIILEKKSISGRYRGKLHGWTKYLDDRNDDYCVLYDNGLTTEKYSVIYKFDGAIIQINDTIYLDTDYDHNCHFHEYVVDSLKYNGPFVFTQPINSICCIPLLTDVADVLAISQNLLNLLDGEDENSMFVINIIQRNSRYCLNCQDVTDDENCTSSGWFNCCDAANLVSWHNNREAILASLKIHDPDVYALLSPKKPVLSIHE
jgi:hypothetical protein